MLLRDVSGVDLKMLRFCRKAIKCPSAGERVIGSYLWSVICHRVSSSSYLCVRTRRPRLYVHTKRTRQGRRIEHKNVAKDFFLPFSNWEFFLFKRQNKEDFSPFSILK